MTQKLKAKHQPAKLGRTVRRFNTGRSDITCCAAPARPSKLSVPHANQRADLSFAAPDEFYTFVVQHFDGRWSFVSVGAHRLVIYEQPRQIFRTVDDTLRALWRRAVIDGAVTTDEMVDISTLRLMKMKVAMCDASSMLFDGDSDEATFRRMAAVAKLSDKEARLLRLVREKAMLRLFQAPMDSAATQRLLDKVSDLGEDYLPGMLVTRV